MFTTPLDGEGKLREGMQKFLIAIVKPHNHYSYVHQPVYRRSTPFMVLSVMCTLCKGPKLDAYRSQSVMPANCQYDSIRQHK
jgi:hypothetical protein